jgi:transcriptional regulator with XRE-family HTH domain
MKLHDLDVKGLARVSGLSEWCIYKLLTGERTRPRIDTLYSLAHALSVPIDFLIAVPEATTHATSPASH